MRSAFTRLLGAAAVAVLAFLHCCDGASVGWLGACAVVRGNAARMP